MRPIDRRLIKACQNGDALTVEKLLRHGANPNAKDDCRRYRTALIIATQHGHIPIINLLIQHGADPYATDREGQIALHHAVEYQYHDIVQYLITELKLDPNKKDHWGRTPLMLTSANGDIKTIQLLIQHGANPHATDCDGKTALHYALESQNHHTAQYLLTQLHINPNTQDRQGQTPFLLATQNGDIHMLQLLIQNGANPHTIDHNGRSALHCAIEKQYHDIAQYLLTQLQIDPNTQERWGRTPFMMAALNGDIKMLRILIQHGADPHIQDDFGRTALHYAVKNQNYDIAQYLLTQLHINPNIQDPWGRTPFIIATEKGDIKMLRILIQHGADPYTIDRYKKNALHHAAEEDQYETIHFLINHLDFDPNTQDHDGNTPLLIAIKNSKIKTAQTLIQLGANPHIPDHNGRTPAALAKQKRIRLKPQPSTITL